MDKAIQLNLVMRQGTQKFVVYQMDKEEEVKKLYESMCQKQKEASLSLVPIYLVVGTFPSCFQIDMREVVLVDCSVVQLTKKEN